MRAQKSLRGLPRLASSALRLARRADPRLFYISTALQLANAGIMSAQILLAKVAIERVLSQAGGGGSVGVVLPPLIAMIAVTALGGLAASSQVHLQRLLGEEVQRLTWTSILDVTTRVPLETFESPDFFDDLQRVRANALLRPVTLAQGLIGLVGGVFGAVGLSIALFVVKPILLPVLLAGGLPLWLLSRRTGRIEFNFRTGQTPQLRLRWYLTELLCGRNEAKEIRAFGLGPVVFGRWDDNYREYLDDYRRHIRRRVWLSGLSALVTTVVMSVSLGILVWLIVERRIGLAGAGAGLIAIRLLGGQLGQVFSGVGDLFESALFLGDFDAFVADNTPAEQDAVSRARPVAPFTELAVENVCFRYPGTRGDTLHDVSLTLRAGEVVALVGENGSGKTTLAKLLAQLFEPTCGRILWDGVDARELDGERLRSNVGVIFQDFVRYQLSARENVGFGRAEAIDDLAAIAAAARLGGAHDYLSRLPDGYDTSLGKEFVGGYDLSIGQWQRVALSRAFFRDAGFLVLDEPTASLDARSEHELFEYVQDLAAGRCLLLISHRFSTVRSADRIYVMHGGEIVEEGNHDELMLLDGRYAELFELQAQAYR
ncbi:MAG TPA: ABC transporter ATP-binding protein [Solirubrobacteraceae bacterium]|nr:ABC transporter ATP-binding protein [Solirubrobacteraceae bacterium]